MSLVSVSTNGALMCAAVGASSMGELSCVLFVLSEEEVRRGGSSDISHTIVLARIKRDDEEILAIIMAAMDIIK